MKRFALLFQILFLCITSLFSQTSPEETRIAFTNYYKLGDKNGVIKLKEAWNLFSNEGFNREISVLIELKERAKQKANSLEN
ncbi:MAG TPA: hypothetical protein PKY82_09400 [Pyrinomonadaceae bacterium]|nr:hypothetical protein [Pyrinomonadaceae bacterium]